jgi:hypothetical protein
LAIELVDGDHFGDFGDLFLHFSFDAHFESHLCAGASFACTLEPHGNDARVFCNIDEFDIAAIGLEHGSDLLDDCFYFVFHRVPFREVRIVELFATL